MKIIFLDVDGVLNSANDLYSIELKNDKHFDLLKELVDKSGAKIVLSSSWRIGFSPATHKSDNVLDTKLKDRGISIYDFTPCMTGERSDEIHEWLKENPVDKFVIIDDEEVSDPNLVQTDTMVGLQKEDIEKALKILA